jgi:hypothetical protein
MLLTFLGLKLATTTSTELQIASNYRWNQLAYYHAEAGLELGKRILRQTDWSLVLPAPRDFVLDTTRDCNNGKPTPVYTRTGPGGETSRNFENCECDIPSGDRPGGIEGYGVVLDVPSYQYPFQNTSQVMGKTLNGSFTLWIRRPVCAKPGPSVTGTDETVYCTPAFAAIGDRVDYRGNNRVVLTAEGSAPHVDPSRLETPVGRRRAIRYLEVLINRIEQKDCENRISQAGAGPEGANFDQCDKLKSDGILVEGLSVTETSPGAQ